MFCLIRKRVLGCKIRSIRESLELSAEYGKFRFQGIVFPSHPFPAAQNMTTEKQRLRDRIRELRQQHGELKEAIDRLLLGPVPDQLRISRIKKEKLRHKDEIAKLEDLLFPDIIA